METRLFKNIAFSTDFSENADEAFVTAKELAAHYRATLHIVHVMVNYSLSPPIHATYMPIEYDPNFVEQVTEAAKKTIQEHYVSKLESSQRYVIHLLSGYASTEILRITKEMDVDLIVMGSHGLTGLAHVLFGSTADRVVRKAHCSVLTIRSSAKTE
ncbi:MAG: universal stress protein [Syntrophobacteraceae bacterium]|nr:universal stress protein [Desulfobacteraceae bacterium]